MWRDHNPRSFLRRWLDSLKNPRNRVTSVICLVWVMSLMLVMVYFFEGSLFKSGDHVDTGGRAKVSARAGAHIHAETIGVMNRPVTHDAMRIKPSPWVRPSAMGIVPGDDESIPSDQGPAAVGRQEEDGEGEELQSLDEDIDEREHTHELAEQPLSVEFVRVDKPNALTQTLTTSAGRRDDSDLNGPAGEEWLCDSADRTYRAFLPAIEHIKRTPKPLEGMSICFISSGVYGPTLTGGIAHAVWRQSLLASRQGARVVTLGAVASMKNTGKWQKFYREHNLELRTLLKDSGTYGTGRMKMARRVHQTLLSWQDEFDVFIFHDIYGLAVYVESDKRAGFNFQNTVILVHAHGSSKLSNFFNGRAVPDVSTLVKYAMERQSLELADVVLSPSRWYVQWMYEQGYKLDTRRISVVGLLRPPDDSTFRYSGVRHLPVVRKLAFFGRFDVLKGVFFFMDALDKMVARRSSLLPELVMFAGDSVVLTGENGKPIESANIIRQRSRGWPFPVKILHKPKTADVFQMLLDEDYVLVNPTFGEASSTVAVEAASAGVPIIISDTCATSELFGNSTIFQAQSFMRGDTKGLLDCIQNALRHGAMSNSPRLDAEKSEHLFTAVLYSVAQTKSSWKPALGLDIPIAEKQEILQRSSWTANSTKFGQDNVLMMPLSMESSSSAKVLARIGGGLTMAISACRRPKLLAVNLRALTKQVYVPPISEVLIAECGSSMAAKTQKVVEKYNNRLLLKFAQVRLLRLERQSSAPRVRNEIFLRAHHKYVILIDDDDVPKPDMIAKLFLTAVRTGASVVTGFLHNFAVDARHRRKMLTVSLAAGDAVEAALLVHHLGKSNMLVQRQDVIDSGGCTEDVGPVRSPYVDWDMYLKLVASGRSVTIVPHVTALYRTNSKHSLFYQADKRKSFYGIYRLVSSYCTAMNIPPTHCSALHFGVEQLAPAFTSKKN